MVKSILPFGTNHDYFRLCDLLGCGADGAGGWEGLTAGCQSQGSRGRSREAGEVCGLVNKEINHQDSDGGVVVRYSSLMMELC